MKTGARGNVRQIARLIAPQGVVRDTRGGVTVVRHSLVAGRTPQEALTCNVGAREGLAQAAIALARESFGQTGIALARAAYGIKEPSIAKGFSVLSRAMHAQRPGIVFASAAAIGEIDPLTDPDSRLFVGLSVQ